MTALLAARLSSLKFSKNDILAYSFIAVWVLSMIALPIVRWIVGDSALSFGIIATVIAQVAAVFIAVSQHWGLKRTVWTLAIVAVVTWVAETIGSRTGLPFGDYHYTTLLQPQIAGVPFFVPLAWFMMLPPAWAVAQVVVGVRNRYIFALMSAVALTAWDLFLDPQKVAWGFWVWTDSSGMSTYSGGYFGIPWLNFLGWLLVAAIVTILVRPTDLPVRPLLLIYGITWIFQTIGQLFFWNLPGPALAGFLGMGFMLVLVWRHLGETT
jgi:putative membrane protein